MVKRVIIVMIIFQVIFIPIVNASTMDSVLGDGEKFLNDGKNSGSDVLDQSQLKVEVNNVYNVLFAIGVGLSVIIGAILGIKFMMGSVEEQAKIKETLIPYALGCIVIFGAFGIWKIVLTIGGNVF